MSTLSLDGSLVCLQDMILLSHVAFFWLTAVPLTSQTFYSNGCLLIKTSFVLLGGTAQMYGCLMVLKP